MYLKHEFTVWRSGYIQLLLPAKSDGSPLVDSVEVMLKSVLPPVGGVQQYTWSQYSMSQKSTSGGQRPGGWVGVTGREKWE